MGRQTPDQTGEPMMLLTRARVVLTRAWLIGVGILGAILVVASILRGRSDAAHEVWSWFLPLVLPTVGLMIGVLGSAAVQKSDGTLVRKSFADVALWLSIAYLITVSLTILLEPFAPLRGADLHSMSNYWLGPFQGLVVAALGYLFTSGEKPGEPPASKL